MTLRVGNGVTFGLTDVRCQGIQRIVTPLGWAGCRRPAETESKARYVNVRSSDALRPMFRTKARRTREPASDVPPHAMSAFSRLVLQSVSSVILPRSDWELWLAPVTAEADRRRPYPTAEMICLTVSVVVGSPRVDVRLYPTIITRVEHS